jgi:hypothetical protein
MTTSRTTTGRTKRGRKRVAKRTPAKVNVPKAYVYYLLDDMVVETGAVFR